MLSCLIWIPACLGSRGSTCSQTVPAAPPTEAPNAPPLPCRSRNSSGFLRRLLVKQCNESRRSVEKLIGYGDIPIVCAYQSRYQWHEEQNGIGNEMNNIYTTCALFTVHVEEHVYAGFGHFLLAVVHLRKSAQSHTCRRYVTRREI